MLTPAVLVEQVSRSYKSGVGRITAIDNLSLEIEAGAQIALIGPSGSGKTTLLSLIGALERPDCGDISLFSEDITCLSESEAANFRRHHVGFIFQDDALMSELTVAENVALPLILQKVATADIKRRVTDVLADLNLLKFSRSFPQSLSGGEKQRVAVGRAVIHQPKLLLADEPTASLDSQAADLVLDTISKLAAAYSLTVIMATHDLRVHKRFPQKLELFDGKLLRR